MGAVMFPDHDSTRSYLSQSVKDRYEQIRRVCERCPVKAECAEAGEDEPYGMWGGLRPDERLRNRRSPIRDAITAQMVHGSYRGSITDLSRDVGCSYRGVMRVIQTMTVSGALEVRRDGNTVVEMVLTGRA